MPLNVPLNYKEQSPPWTSHPTYLGEGVVLDLEAGDVLVLVGGDGDELRGREGAREDLLDVLDVAAGQLRLLLAAHPHHVHARLVLVQRVEHDLPVARRLVGQLHLGEADGLLRPVAAVIGRVGVAVHRVRWVGLRLSTCNLKLKS